MASREKKPVHKVVMTEGKRNIIQQLLQEYDIQEALKDLLGGTIKEMMEAEMDEHLGYQKSQRSDSEDHRNGYKSKRVNSSYGSMDIQVPQDRKSTFEPQIVRKRQKDISSIDQKIISMYAKGMTTRQISETLEDIYGFEASEGFISDVTDKILPQIEDWQKRPLTEVYPVLYIDAIHYSVRDNGVKYSDVDYINRTLKVQRQLGKKINTKKEDFAPKTYTKKEVRLKTPSSYRDIPIQDYVFKAILEQRKIYERNRSRQTTVFEDSDYICCSVTGRPRSKDFHWSHYKKLLEKNHLPNIRWHDLRSTFCTRFLKNDFNPKAVSKLMGHAKEIITMDVYGDNRGIIADCVDEIQPFIDEVLPTEDLDSELQTENIEVVVSADEYLI